jgi:ADP-ribosylglycohydrolase
MNNLLDAKRRGKKRWRSPFDLGMEAQGEDKKSYIDVEFASRCLPLALLFSTKNCQDEALLKACKEVSLLSTDNRRAMLSAFALAWVARELIRNSEAMESIDELCLSDRSMIARLIEICRQVECIIEKKEKIHDKLSLRLQEVRNKIDQDRSLEEFVGVNGNSWKHIEAVPLALFCFLKSSDDLDSVKNAATLGGASTFVAGFTGALVGCYSGLGFIPEETRESIEGQGSIMEVSRKLSSLAFSKLEKQEFSL